MKKVLLFVGTFFTMCGLSHGAIGTGPGGSFVPNSNILTPNVTFYVSSATVKNVNTSTITFADGSKQTTAAVSASGASSLQIKVNGTQISSPTITAAFDNNFLGNQSPAGTANLSLNPGCTLYIQNASSATVSQVANLSSATIRGPTYVYSGNQQVTLLPSTTVPFLIVNTSSETAFIQIKGSGVSRWRIGSDVKALNNQEFDIFNEATGLNSVSISTNDVATFAGSINGNTLTASKPVKTDASKNLSSGLIDVTADITGTVPSTNLPSNIDYTNVQQTISASKVFSSSQTFTSTAAFKGAVLDGTSSAGSNGQVWTSQGNGTYPTWQTSSGGGMTPNSTYYIQNTASPTTATQVFSVSTAASTNLIAGNSSVTDPSMPPLFINPIFGGLAATIGPLNQNTPTDGFIYFKYASGYGNYGLAGIQYNSLTNYLLNTSYPGFIWGDSGSIGLYSFKMDYTYDRFHIGRDTQYWRNNLNVEGNASIGSSGTTAPVNGLYADGTGKFNSGVSASTMTITSLNCTGNTNGGKLTTDSSGNVTCGDDVSGGGGGGTTIWAKKDGTTLDNAVSTVNVVTSNGLTVTSSPSGQINISVSTASATSTGTLTATDYANFQTTTTAAGTYLTRSSATTTALTGVGTQAQTLNMGSNGIFNVGSSSSSFSSAGGLVVKSSMTVSGGRTTLSGGTSGLTGSLYVDGGVLHQTTNDGTDSDAAVITYSPADNNQPAIELYNLASSTNPYYTLARFHHKYNVDRYMEMGFKDDMANGNDPLFAIAPYKTGTKSADVFTVDVATSGANVGNVNATGSMTATTYYGDGSHLTGIVGGGGGASTLAVGTGTASNFTNNVSSPTGAIAFEGTQIHVTALPSGSTAYVVIDTMSSTGLMALSTGTNGAGQLARLNASSQLAAANIAQLVSTRTLPIPFDSMNLVDANFAPPVIVSTTNVSESDLQFDDTTQQSATFKFFIPDNIVATGTMTFVVDSYYATSASGRNIQWDLGYVCGTQGTTTSSIAYSSTTSSAFPLVSTNYAIQKTTWTAAVSALSNWSAGNSCFGRIARNPGPINDLVGNLYGRVLRMIFPVTVN